MFSQLFKFLKLIAKMYLIENEANKKLKINLINKELIIQDLYKKIENPMVLLS